MEEGIGIISHKHSFTPRIYRPHYAIGIFNEYTTKKFSFCFFVCYVRANKGSLRIKNL